MEILKVHEETESCLAGAPMHFKLCLLQKAPHPCEIFDKPLQRCSGRSSSNWCEKSWRRIAASGGV